MDMDIFEIIRDIEDSILIDELNRRGYVVTKDHKSYDFTFKVKNSESENYDLYGINIVWILDDWCKYFDDVNDEVLFDLGFTDLAEIKNSIINSKYAEETDKIYNDLVERIKAKLKSLIGEKDMYDSIPEGLQEYCEIWYN